VRCAAFDDAKNFLHGDEVTKRGQSKVGPRKNDAGGKDQKKKRKEKDVSYVGVRAVCEDGDEDAPVESVGHAVCSECMREGTGGF
jgi:hypothetical protein